MATENPDSRKVLAMRKRQQEMGCRRIDSTLDPQHSQMFNSILEAEKQNNETIRPKDILQEMVNLAYRVKFGEATLVDLQRTLDLR